MMAYIPPQTLPEYMNLPDEVILTGTAKGTLDKVRSQLRLLSTRGNNKSHIAIKGIISQFATPQDMDFDVDVQSLQLHQQELAAYLPDSILPEYIVLPSILDGKGAIKGH